MKVLGITGGVGAGKSTILNYLRETYGAVVIQCDETARVLQLPGGVCFRPVLELLQQHAGGRVLLQADGSFDRMAAADLLFSQPVLLEKVNGIVHPAVKKEVCRQIKKAETAGAPLAVVEAALLLEEHYDEGICDEVWYIYAEEPVRIARLSAQRGYSEEKSRAIMARQLPDAAFRERCALTVDNSSENVHNTFDQIDKGLIEHGFVQYSKRQQR